MKIETEEACEVTVAGQDYYVECTISGTCEYSPAILGGPPENCSPEESEGNVESVEILWASRLVDSATTGPVKDPALLKKLELAIDEDWALDCLWAAFNAQEDFEPEDEDEDEEAE